MIALGARDSRAHDSVRACFFFWLVMMKLLERWAGGRSRDVGGCWGLLSLGHATGGFRARRVECPGSGVLNAHGGMRRTLVLASLASPLPPVPLDVRV